MHITIVGTGYVGLVSGACLAEIGHTVTCVDVDTQKVAMLNQGKSPIYEPGLEKIIHRNQKNERLLFSSSLALALHDADVLFIAVGTPDKECGGADLSQVHAVVEEVAKEAERDLLVLVKSTVPIGTCDEIDSLLKARLAKLGKSIVLNVASNPEFLKEGDAVADFMHPDRIVVGMLSGSKDQEKIKELYRPFLRRNPSVLLFVERRASEMIKYVANSMLAMRISFMNEIAQLCERLRVDVDEVRIGIGSDPRIGSQFLHAGPGYGGSCFPKDVSALLEFSKAMDLELKILQAVQVVNDEQQEFAFEKVRRYFKDLSGKKIAIWGLSFKPGTDDVRKSPAITIIRRLLEHGAEVCAYDPIAAKNFSGLFPNTPALSYQKDFYQVCQGADALVLVTEWQEYRYPNWTKISSLLRKPVLFDFRNQHDPKELAARGFYYASIGRSDQHPGLGGV